MIKSLKHLILALFVFLGFSQTPTAAETIIMACDVTTTISASNKSRHQEKQSIFKGEFGTFSSEIYMRHKGEWKEFCTKRPNYVSGTIEVTYLDKSFRCVRKDYIYERPDNGELQMLNNDIVLDFAFGRIEGRIAYLRKNEGGVFEEYGTQKIHDCEIQK